MDMYSMGIAFYEIATLRHPYTVADGGDFVDAWRSAHFSQMPANPCETNDQLDSQLAQVIMKMISKRPADRYDSWDALLERLHIRVVNTHAPRAVGRLAELATTLHQRAERDRLAREDKARKEKEQVELLTFSFKEILDRAQDTVETFNAHSEFLKLEIKKHDLAFSIFSSKGAGALPTVNCAVQTAENISIGYSEFIRGWGLVKSPSGRGFNLLLVATGADDLYGRWQALHVTQNPIIFAEGNQPIMVGKDERPEPFGFELHELRDKIHSLNAIDVYQYSREAFRAELLESLIEELITDY
jgi:eukaryotic-like serine/threonine-protein kinase